MTKVAIDELVESHFGDEVDLIVERWWERHPERRDLIVRILDERLVFLRKRLDRQA